MAEPFLSEIRIFSFDFPPKGWAFCNGQLLPINQNQALYALLGTTYGGNGQTDFALPNLKARVAIHEGVTTLGNAGGEEAHTVTLNEMPQHQHFLMATPVTGTGQIPGPTVMLANSGNYEQYRAASNPVPMNAGSVTSVGGSQPHENRQPYLVLNYCIALQGIFPSQN